MYEVFLAFITGAAVGVIFAMVKLPIPAPPVLSGVIGIVGIYSGALAYNWIVERFFS